MTTITFESDVVKVKYWGGLGRSTTIDYNELTGYKIFFLSDPYLDVFEYMFIMKDDSTAIILSQFYHKNYSALRNHIKTEIPQLEYTGFQLIPYLKSMCL